MSHMAMRRTINVWKSWQIYGRTCIKVRVPYKLPHYSNFSRHKHFATHLTVSMMCDSNFFVASYLRIWLCLKWTPQQWLLSKVTSRIKPRNLPGSWNFGTINWKLACCQILWCCFPALNTVKQTRYILSPVHYDILVYGRKTFCIPFVESTRTDAA